MEKPYIVLAPVLKFSHSEEAPSTTAAPCKILPHDPAFPLAGMSLQCPLPQRLEDGVINTAEDAFALYMAVVQGPTAYDAVEFCDQLPRRSRLRSSDDFTDFIQKSPDILAGRFDQQLAIAVPPQVLSEEVQALFDMRGLCLLRR